MGSSQSGIPLAIQLVFGKMLVDTVSGRELTRHRGRAAGRANRVANREPMEVGALGSQAIDVRRTKLSVAVTRQIAPSPVVGKDENNVRTPVFGKSYCGKHRLDEEQQRNSKDRRDSRRMSSRHTAPLNQ